jgi:hypothetical protein
MYAVIEWWPRVGLLKVRAECGRLQRMACLSITGSVKTTPTAALKVLPGLPCHLVAEAEVQVCGLVRFRMSVMPGSLPD